MAYSRFLTIFLTGCAVFAGDLLQAGTKPPSPPPAKTSYEKSIVRISSTNQSFDFNVPWKKQNPYTRKGVGVVVEGGRILVTADLIVDHTYIELQDPAGTKRCAAIVELVDYDSNLALLKPGDPDFLNSSVALSLDTQAKLGDAADVLQLERNGSVVITHGTVTSVMVGPYFVDDVAMLIFRVSLPLQYRDNSFVLPVANQGKLVGLLMRYDSRAQFADLIPPPVIAHFLEAADHPPYKSFPRAEMSYAPLHDPQLRKYIGIGDDLANRGIYVTSVIPHGPADTAGIQAGDVILAVAGQPLDADGNFNHPLYGLIPFNYIISTESTAGQKVPFTVWRKGETKEIPVKVEPRDISKMVSAPYLADSAPDYYVIGGLVFQELSRDYLREWGKNWQREAPQKLLYYDQYQEELPADRGKIVILNQVLANEAAYGYEELNNLVVKSVNGQLVKSLRDLVKAFKRPINGYDRIEFEDDPGVIYLDADLSERLKDQIKTQYNLPALENLSPQNADKPADKSQ